MLESSTKIQILNLALQALMIALAWSALMMNVWKMNGAPQKMEMNPIVLLAKMVILIPLETL
jgi:hypothetical protein